MDDHLGLDLLKQLGDPLYLNAGKLPAHVVGVRVGDKGMGYFHLIFSGDPQNLLDVPCRIHHRHLACLFGSHQIDEVLHGTDFNLLEIKVIAHVAFGALQNENCKVQNLKFNREDSVHNSLTVPDFWLTDSILHF